MVTESQVPRIDQVQDQSRRERILDLADRFGASSNIVRFQIDKSINEEDLQRLRSAGGPLPATKQQQIRAIERTISSLDNRISNAIARRLGDKPQRVVRAQESAFNKFRAGEQLTPVEQRRVSFLLGKQFQAGRSRFSEEERQLLVQSGRLQPGDFEQISESQLTQAQFENEKRQEQIRRQINLEYRQDYLGRLNETVDKLNQKAIADSPGSPQQFRQTRFDYIVGKIQEKGGLPDTKITATDAGFGAAVTPESAKFSKGFEQQLGLGTKFNILKLAERGLFPNIFKKAQEIIPKDFQVKLTAATPIFIKEGLKRKAEKTQAPSVRFSNIVQPKLRRETERIVRTYPGLPQATIAGLQGDFIAKEQSKFLKEEEKKRYDSASRVGKIFISAVKGYDDINKKVAQFKFIPVGSKYGGIVSISEFFGKAYESTVKRADELSKQKGILPRLSEFSLRITGSTQKFIADRPITAPIAYGTAVLAGPAVARLATLRVGAVALKTGTPIILGAAGLSITEGALGAGSKQGVYNLLVGEGIKFGAITKGLRVGANAFLSRQATLKVYQIKQPIIRTSKSVGGRKAISSQGISETKLLRPQFKKQISSYGGNTRITTITRGTFVDQFQKFKVFGITRGRITRGSLTGQNPYGFKQTIVFKQVKNLVNFRVIDSSGKIIRSGQFTSSDNILKGLKFKQPIIISQVKSLSDSLKVFTPRGVARPIRQILTKATVQFFGKESVFRGLKPIRKAIFGRTTTATTQIDIARPQIETTKFGFPKPYKTIIQSKVADIVYSKNPILKPNIQVFRKFPSGQGTISTATYNLQRPILTTARKFTASTKFIVTYKQGFYIPRPNINRLFRLFPGKKAQLLINPKLKVSGLVKPKTVNPRQSTASRFLARQKSTFSTGSSQQTFSGLVKIQTQPPRAEILKLLDPRALISPELLTRLTNFVRPRTGIFGLPIVRTDPLVRTLTDIRTRTKTFTEPSIRQIKVPRVEVQPLIKSIVRTEVRTRTDTRQRSRTITETLTPTPSSGTIAPIIIPEIPLSGPPIFPPYLFELQPTRPRKRQKQLRGRRVLKYNPSLIARYFNIRDEEPELLTGLGLRPIIGRRRKRRKR